MDVGVCMNGMCANSNSEKWLEGWRLRSGGVATLCHDCGTDYKNLAFCETFHSEDSGWRECTSCGKRLHCGCIASTSLLELLDTGGVNCKNCSQSSQLLFARSDEKHKTCCQLTDDAMDQNVNGVAPGKEIAGSVELSQELLLGFNESPAGPSRSYVKPNSKTTDDDGMPLVQTNLSISLSNLSNLSNLSGVIAEEKGFMTTISPFQHGCKPRHLLPSLPNSFLIAGFEQNSGTGSQLCVARPPVEGRVKNQLLPRYWPRITEQELQQLSGDSNSTIVPLFEKVLSASDAGRVGRLVLPKACAEAYFPPISQPEGHPLRIQDVKGNEWVFQFRFWPNNNSRMYVLEGVSPCIRSMQLQAGDTGIVQHVLIFEHPLEEYIKHFTFSTQALERVRDHVTFSRIDPEGGLLMGFRKAPSSFSSRKDPLVTMNTSAFQALNVSTKDICPRIIQKNFSCAGDNLLAASSLHPERKRRNIGPKSKRLLINSHDSLELRLTWEEVQDALRPPPSVKAASTFSVEDHEFEEFEELPVFGKQSIFIIRPSGEYEQWSQCDCCLKWRKLPIDVLLPPKWTCQDSVNDSRRISCSAPDELSSREIESLLVMNKEFTKMRLSTSLKAVNETEPKELGSASKTAAVGSNISEPCVSSVATTTKHPRHRPGCSCIVCIQPPSGKGKHKPTCGCYVCMTVKRRFKTLMMRKKKRQSELVEKIAPKNHSKPALKEEPEVESIPAQVVHSDNEKGAESEILFRCHCNFVSHENAEVIKKGLDLNCHPCQEHTSPSVVSMMSLLQEASLPLDTYLRQNGLQSLVSDQNAASVLVIPQLPREIMAQPHEDKGFSDAIQEQDEGDASNSEKDLRE